MGVYRRRGTKENHGLLVSAVFIIFILSILPSIKIPYIRDEIDIMHSAASLLNSKEVLPWLLAPHNEHIIFFLKIFYLQNEKPVFSVEYLQNKDLIQKYFKVALENGFIPLAAERKLDGSFLFPLQRPL